MSPLIAKSVLKRSLERATSRLNRRDLLPRNALIALKAVYISMIKNVLTTLYCSAVEKVTSIGLTESQKIYHEQVKKKNLSAIFQ